MFIPFFFFSFLLFIVGFAVSALASNWERLGKPFNPLLGETYEYQNEEFRIVCEQVSHHPPVSSFHADSPHFKFYGAIHPKLKFWGKSVEIQPKGVVTVELIKWNESYTWSNVNCCVHNIIVGKMWIEQYGTMEIVNKQNGIKAVLQFKPAGWASKDLHRVEGTIYDKRLDLFTYTTIHLLTHSFVRFVAVFHCAFCVFCDTKKTYHLLFRHTFIDI